MRTVANLLLDGAAVELEERLLLSDGDHVLQAERVRGVHPQRHLVGDGERPQGLLQERGPEKEFLHPSVRGPRWSNKEREC